MSKENKNKEEIIIEIDNLKEERNQIKEEISAEKTRLEELKKQSEIYEQEAQRQKSELNAREEGLNKRELDIKKNELELKKREDNAKQGFTKQLGEAKDVAEAEIKKLKAEKEKLEKDLAELGSRKDKKIAQIDEDVSAYREKRCAAVDDEIEKKRKKSLDDATKIVQEATTRSNSIISDAQKEADKIKNDAAKEIEKQKEELAQAEQDTEKEKANYEAQAKQMLEKKAKYEEKKTEHEMLSEYLREKEKGIDAEVESRVQEKYADLNNKYGATRENCNELAKENKKLNEEKAKLQLDLSKARSQNDGQKDVEIAALQEKVKELEKQVREKDEKISEYGCEPNKVDEYRKKSQKYELACEKGKKLSEEIEKLELALSFRNDGVEQLELYKQKDVRNKDTIRELSEELEKKKIVPRDVRIAPIKEELPSINKNNGLKPFKSNLSEKTWLDTIMLKTKESGLVFSRRLLNAYHTSLKIGEWSPLVVLAGVSGTGKSELPRQYALHGGMNFISVPVKPDWDSPQSLFGYYNSIESKFEPTELLRALYQMQDNKEANSKGDQMCLVLLDEMNLAHVELYFADLLSKFEGKRGTKEGAEYEISLGAGVGNEILNIGDNILWTGTMNEDETTKALSDKVVDRSTLVTFPRPKHLIGRQKAKIVDATAILSKKKWLEWVGSAVDLDNYEELMNKLRSIVEQINDKMSELGRNLGHRVWQGIQNYISNHPDVIEAHAKNDNAEIEKVIKSVFAEAVAFKIMPKLRGVETTGEYEEYIDDIGKIISENIEELSEDFNKARNLPTRVFQWCSAKFLDDKE